jgi:hypothetical protein
VSDMGKNIVLWLVILAVLLTVFNKFDVAPQTPELSYSEFLRDVEQGRVTSATIQGDKIYAEDTSGNKVTVTRLSSDLALTDHAMGLFWVPLVFSCESGSVRRAWDTGIGGRSRDPGVGRPRPGPREHAALSYEGCP